MSRYRQGERVEVAERRAVVVRTILDEEPLEAAEVQLDDGEHAVVWAGHGPWVEALEVLEAGDGANLPRVMARGEYDGETRALLSAPPPRACAFDDYRWRSLNPQAALAALESLVGALHAAHRAGLSLHGVRRSDLYLDAESERCFVVAAPRLRRVDELSAEVIWRDARLIGELVYENFMGEDYPGGHQMAALLQERSAMAEVGFLQPGLTQLVAACVSPYGELALQSINDLQPSIEQLRLELDSPLSFRTGATSTVGNYIFRRNNQDSCGHIIMRSIAGSAKTTVGFFCVADGIGGIEDGERASKLAVESACLAFGRAWSHYGAEALAERPTAFARAIGQVTSQRLALEGEFDAGQNRGGTTFTGLVLAGGRAGLCHVGDSRAMLVRGTQSVALSTDHTLARIMANLGEAPSSTAQDEANHRTISRFLGTGTELEIERIDGLSRAAVDALALEPAAEERGFDIERGDIFVLTSDGVHDEIPAERFAQLVQLHRHDPQALSNALVQHALSQVGRDNATALVVLVE